MLRTPLPTKCKTGASRQRHAAFDRYENLRGKEADAGHPEGSPRLGEKRTQGVAHSVEQLSVMQVSNVVKRADISAYVVSQPSMHA
jgi:hypothetical protein